MPGNCHGHMTSTGCFIIGVDDFAIFEDADTGCAAADINNCTVCDLEDSSGSSRLIYDIHHFESGTFQYIADAFDTAFGNSRRDGSSSIGELGAKFFLELCFQLCDKLNGFIIVYDHTVTNCMRRCGDTCNWSVCAVNNRKDRIGSTEIHTDLQTASEFLAFSGSYQFCKIR